jgi:hypothetical protein
VFTNPDSITHVAVEEPAYPQQKHSLGRSFLLPTVSRLPRHKLGSWCSLTQVAPAFARICDIGEYHEETLFLRVVCATLTLAFLAFAQP